MLPYPQIDPVAVAIGPLKIHWYGLMYLVGIGGAWLLASRRLNRFDQFVISIQLSWIPFRQKGIQQHFDQDVPGQMRPKTGIGAEQFPQFNRELQIGFDKFASFVKPIIVLMMADNPSR